MNEQTTVDNFIKSRGLQQTRATARRQALIDFVGDGCWSTPQIASWFQTVSKQPMWHGIVSIESVLRRAVMDKDLYCQKRRKAGKLIGHYQTKPHGELPEAQPAINPFDYGHELALRMGYAHIKPRSKATEYTASDAPVASMPAQTCRSEVGSMQSSMGYV